jgi:DNA repair exonuclease SbcCD ATPase subunit
MKIKKLIKLLEVIDGKLPSDMQVLPEYIYDGDNTNAPIGDMDFVHFVRAFVKMKTTLNEEVRRDTQEGKIAYLKEDMAQNYVRKDVYEMLFDKCERLEERLADVHEKLSSQERARVMRIKDLKEQLEQKKSTIDALIGENKRRIQENYELRHPRYVFSEIPNDCDGQRFIDDVKKYFNKGTYRMRVRGQHVKEEYKGTGVTTHGQNIEQSTHLRVYIEEKE